MEDRNFDIPFDPALVPPPHEEPGVLRPVESMDDLREKIDELQSQAAEYDRIIAEAQLKKALTRATIANVMDGLNVLMRQLQIELRKEN